MRIRAKIIKVRPAEVPSMIVENENGKLIAIPISDNDLIGARSLTGKTVDINISISPVES
jgi:hypothetical protein